MTAASGNNNDSDSDDNDKQFMTEQTDFDGGQVS